MTIRKHTDTEAPARGLDAVLEDLQQWASDHLRAVGIGAGVLVVIGLVVAGVAEMRQRNREAAQLELSRIEADFAQAMGSSRDVALVPEPANADQARSARERAIEQLDADVASHPRADAARAARLRAAEIELDLGRLEAADARLAALIGELSDRDPRKGIALRLRALVLEELERPLEAAPLYEAAGRLAAYPPRALAWLAAGRTYARLGQNGDAARAYREAIQLEPELAQDSAIQSDLATFEAATAPAEGPGGGSETGS